MRLASEVHRRSMDASKVELLSLLSGPLRLELQKELCAPILRQSEFFRAYEATSDAAITRICDEAIETSMIYNILLVVYDMTCYNILASAIT